MSSTVRVIAAQGRDPDPSTSSASCTHHTEVVRNAMARLVRDFELPDLTTRRGLKRCYHDFDNVSDVLLENVENVEQHEGHASTAAAIALCRICADGGLGEMFSSDDLREALQILLEPGICELRHMVGLELLCRTVKCPPGDLLEQIGTHVIPAVLVLLTRQSPPDNLVAELCVTAICDWAHAAVEEAQDQVIATLGHVGLTLDKVSRQSYSQILVGISQTASLMHSETMSSDDTRVIRSLLLASLQSDSAADRLHALRGYFHLVPHVHRHEWDAGLVTPVPVRDAALSTAARTCALDLTVSEAARFCELTQEFYRAMRSVYADQDYHTLAHALCTIISEDPLVVDFSSAALRRFLAGDPPTADLPPDTSTWADTLKRCVGVLSVHTDQCDSSGRHEDMTLVLGIHDHILRNELDAAAALARPHVFLDGDFWFCYALTACRQASDILLAWSIVEQYMGADMSGRRNLRPLKKSVLYRAAASNISVGAMQLLLHGPLPTAEAWHIIARLGCAALACVKEYFDTAPYDARDVESVHDVRVACELLFSARVSSVLQPRRTAARVIAQRVWHNMRPSFLGPCAGALLDEFPRSAGTWAFKAHFRSAGRRDNDPAEAGFLRGDVHARARQFTPEQVTAWRAMFRGERNGRFARAVSWADAPTALLREMLLLDYPPAPVRACEYCNTPSAVLYRCAACRRVRYCDHDCQRKDWEEQHREQCVRDYL